jgi:hypothetical protein
MYEKKFLMILRSVFTIRVYFAFFVSCQKYVFDNLDPGLVSLFFQDELLVLVLYFIFMNRGEINLFQIYNMGSRNSMELDSYVNMNESPSNGYSTHSYSNHEHLESIICKDTLLSLI